MPIIENLNKMRNLCSLYGWIPSQLFWSVSVLKIKISSRRPGHCLLKFVNWLILIFLQRTFLVYQCKNNCSYFVQEVYHKKPSCFYSNLNLIVLCQRINIIVNMHKFVIQWSMFSNCCGCLNYLLISSIFSNLILQIQFERVS